MMTMMMMMAMAVAFQELQVKVIDTTQKVKIAEMQIEQLKRANQHAKLTDLEIGVLPPDTKTYEAIGRMYEYSIIIDICRLFTWKMLKCRTTISERIKINEDKIRNIEANKEYLQKSVKNQEDNIREMLTHRR
ncbi:hypothetical protein QZH41_017869 [Actinostola sp. cb2023]|nr:hypothetical protein QZH41_017869 [Actinostola sp. cb2023]